MESGGDASLNREENLIMPAKSKSFHGSWRIVHMDEWDEEYLDLVETAHITIDKRGQGEFVFGAVKGWLDCRFTERDGLPFLEFSWEGLSEGDSVVAGDGQAFNPTGVVVAAPPT